LELWLDILLRVAVGILLLIIGWSSRRFYNYIKLTRPLSKVLGTLADGSKHAVIVVPKLYSPPSETVKLKRPTDLTESVKWHPSLPLIAEGDARALMYVYNLLLKSGKTTNVLEIKSDVEVTGEERAGDLVCIGAGSNSVTRNLLTTRNPSLSFEQMTIRTGGQGIRVFGSSVVDRETNKRWMTDQIHDYGLITRLKGPGADTLILAGLGPAGTVASGYFLSVHWKRIYDDLKMRKSIDKNYVVLLQTENADATATNLIKIVVF
jgi:hypothetical protein